MRLKALAICLVVLSTVVGMRAAQSDRRLIDAAKQGNKASVRALLKEKVPVNATATDGTTALHWATRAGDIETVKLLLRDGADVRVADRYGITPLKLAAENGSAEMMAILLKAGAAILEPTPRYHRPRVAPRRIILSR